MSDEHVKPILAFSAAKLFRTESRDDFERFLCQHLFLLSSSMTLLATGGTVEFIKHLLGERRRHDVLFGPNHSVRTATQFKDWKAAIEQSLTNTGAGTRGMVALTNGVVEGTVSAIYHFTDREDVERSIYTQVLARQAIVHNVPIANDLETASAMATAWLPLFSHQGTPFEARKVSCLLTSLAGSKRALGLIAHDQKKLDLCNFVVRFAKTIIERYDALVATGTTCSWIRRFLVSLGYQDFARKVVACQSGPAGGDVQIANAVCEGRCQDVIFFQDPGTSHPHNPDIRLFEQAIYDKADHAKTTRLARNWETAKFIIESAPPLRH